MGLYLAAGKPIISTAVGEIPHYLKDRRTGLFYAAGDVESLSEQVGLVLGDLELAQRIGDNATTEVLPRVDYRSVCSGLKKWIEAESQV
jgi:glycosyltransferase involved in cell wall biosynthesis